MSFVSLVGFSKMWRGLPVAFMVAAAAAAEGNPFPKSQVLFNGSDLSGWEGLAGFWSVQDGAITGRTTADHPAKQNTFLIWRGGLVGDFELRLKVMIAGDNPQHQANSAVQYRSRRVDFSNYVVAGYQVGLDSTGRLVGMLHEEKGRGALAQPGTRVNLLSEKNLPRIDVTGTTATPEALAGVAAAVNHGEWLDLRIVAKGTLLQHYVNGVLTAEVRDFDKVKAADRGLLALQLHAGPPMTVKFKDIVLNTRDDSTAAKPAPAATLPPKPRSDFQVAPGFKVELVHAVPKATEGTWVCLTVDDRGRLIAGDQTGGLFRITPPPVGAAGETKVERLATPLQGAQGLLYAFNSLYVMVNQSVENATGLWRLRDTDGDGTFDEVKLIREMRGTGEHGPHGLTLAPDGKSIYFTNGNRTDLPVRLDASRPAGWDEDHLLPRMWDANGHAKNVFAPGGYIGRTDPEGQRVELFSMGFRNAYDLAFDPNGELFTYDSDMEWDLGSPWYVPTRIVQVVDGGDYGWRSGAGRWPAYYPDSLPAILDVGPGSPTGLTFGYGAKFPARYQRALFACDWTYGTLYAMHLTPAGATYAVEKEEFVSGHALPLTDLIVNPQDGALYFTVGGRNSDSALYRIVYVGTEATGAVGPLPPTPEAGLRHSLEALRDQPTGPGIVATAWPHLADRDRFIRWAARSAIEHQPVELWAERALAETNPPAALEALLGLARVGDKALQPRLIAALSRLKLDELPPSLWLPALRTWQVTFTRMGRPDAATSARLAAWFDPSFPAGDPLVNRELVALLIYLDSPSVVAKTVPLLRASEPVEAELASASLLARNAGYAKTIEQISRQRPDRQQIAFAYVLRNARAGWTPELRRAYFSWFRTTYDWRGGVSFDGFLQNIRRDALETVVSDPSERDALDQRSMPLAKSLLASITPAKGPGRAYGLDEAVRLVGTGLVGRNFAQGRAMFRAGLCIACHRFQGDGNALGPDISGAGQRYSTRDLLESIILPSAVISDQYTAEKIELGDGTVVTGRVVREEAGRLLVLTNLFTPEELTMVSTAQIKSRTGSPYSLMPPGLINGMNEEELKDLVAYVLSGGNPQDAVFKPLR